MNQKIITRLQKLSVTHENPVQYKLKTQDSDDITLNTWIGQHLTIQFKEAIYCVTCNKKIKKSFFNGFCYPCYISSPEASPCILRPELCEAHEKKGRDIDWEVRHHFQPHIVYLSYTSHVKVGVTRATQSTTRWIDQGALAAIVFAETPHRQLAGLIERHIGTYLSDRTHWSKMLTATTIEADLRHIKKEMSDHLGEHHQYYSDQQEIHQFIYPSVAPINAPIKSRSLDKFPTIQGRLIGIKGQYLIFDTQEVFNVRKHTGYEVELTLNPS